MVGTEVLLRAVAALVGLTFASLLLPAARHSRAGLWLAAFLALVAVNQGAEMIRALAPLGAQLAWFRIGSVAATLDPLALYMFAASLRPGTLDKPVRIALVALPAFALGIWAASVTLVPFVNDTNALFPLWLSAFTLVVYGGLLLWTLDALLDEPTRPEWRPFFVAMAIMALPRVGALSSDAYNAVDDAFRIPFEGATYFAIQLAGTITMLGIAGAFLVLRARGRADGVQRSFAGWTIAAAAVLTLVLKSSDLKDWLKLVIGAPDVPIAAIIGQAGSAIRFLLFGAFASTALLRHDALGLSLKARRRSARVLIALAVLLLGAAAIPLVDLMLTGTTGSLTPTEILVVAIALLLSQGFQRGVDRIAFRIYGVPIPGDARASHEAYIRAVATAVAQGRNPALDSELARLRAELELDAPTAAILEGLADETEGGPMREGLHVAGRYQVVRFLGAGGSGRAFLAEDGRLQRRVVLKETREVQDGDAALAEARVAGGLAHPHIVAVHDAFRRRGTWVLVLEHAEGGSLEQVISENRTTPARAEALLHDIIAGAAAVHARGIVHGDLKPQNVLLSRDGRARISDFGLARLARDRTAPLEGTVAGTEGYLAPEQRRGGPVSARTDVFALALIGKRLLPEQIPPDLEPILAKALETDPERRYADAGEMLQAMDASRAQRQ